MSFPDRLPLAAPDVRESAVTYSDAAPERVRRGIGRAARVARWIGRPNSGTV